MRNWVMSHKVATVVGATVVSILIAAIGSAVGSGGGSGGGGCAVWRVSQDDAVVTSTVNNCDDQGSLLTPNGGLDVVSGVPAHGSQVCAANGWTVYTGPDGDPDGEAQSVCNIINQ